jgi:hypothetical protein
VFSPHANHYLLASKCAGSVIDPLHLWAAFAGEPTADRDDLRIVLENEQRVLCHRRVTQPPLCLDALHRQNVEGGHPRQPLQVHGPTRSIGQEEQRSPWLSTHTT